MYPEIVGLGEVLWDLFPAGRQLGGAPYNFAFHCHQLGHNAAIVSRVGTDELGRDIRAAIHSSGMSDELVQADAAHPTGTVTVSLGEGGQPTFHITPDVAWDHLAWDDPLDAVFGRAQAVCFGTLVQRSPVSRATVRRALQAARNALVVCDINLRQHYYDREVIEASLQLSRWLKLNDAELPVVADLLGIAAGPPSTRLRELRRHYHLELAALTRGPDGCLVQTDDQEIDVPGLRVKVVDTVGAGDAFTAGLVAYALEGRDLADAVVFANRLAAQVAACAGGTPRIDRVALER